MKYIKLTDGIYLPQPETIEEHYAIGIQALQRCYFLDADGLPQVYDPITYKFGAADFHEGDA